jgi:hypothetical protein
MFMALTFGVTLVLALCSVTWIAYRLGRGDTSWLYRKSLLLDLLAAGNGAKDEHLSVAAADEYLDEFAESFVKPATPRTSPATSRSAATP